MGGTEYFSRPRENEKRNTYHLRIRIGHHKLFLCKLGRNSQVPAPGIIPQSGVYRFTRSIVGCMLYKAIISSTRAWRSFESGSDLDGSGCQSSMAEVWRTSNCSPGASLPGMLNLGCVLKEENRGVWERIGTQNALNDGCKRAWAVIEIGISCLTDVLSFSWGYWAGLWVTQELH